MFNPTRQARNLIFRRLVSDFQKAGVAPRHNDDVRARTVTMIAPLFAAVRPPG